jgi:hypothetical protein
VGKREKVERGRVVSGERLRYLAKKDWLQKFGFHPFGIGKTKE